MEAERQIRGLHSGRLWERSESTTAQFLTTVLGSSGSGAKTAGRAMDSRMRGVRSTSARARDAPRGAWGVGAVHHLAWRVDDEQHQLAVSGQIEGVGTGVTPVIDRFWFKSVYFREPGGVLFELATDGPGFAADEDPAHLGESLVLPPWLEGSRAGLKACFRNCECLRRRRRDSGQFAVEPHALTALRRRTEDPKIRSEKGHQLLPPASGRRSPVRFPVSHLLRFFVSSFLFSST